VPILAVGEGLAPQKSRVDFAPPRDRLLTVVGPLRDPTRDVMKTPPGPSTPTPSTAWSQVARHSEGIKSHTRDLPPPHFEEDKAALRARLLKMILANESSRKRNPPR
jgi:hypothetical protein